MSINCDLSNTQVTLLFVIIDGMARFRRNAGRRRVFRKRQFRRRNSKFRRGGGFTKRVKRVIRSVAEHKATDTGTLSFILTNSATTSLAASPTQGTAQNQRIGDKIRILSVKPRIAIQRGDTFNFIRLIVVCWRDTTTPGVTDILQNTASPFDQLFSPLFRENLQNKKMIIMYDKLFSAVQTGLAMPNRGFDNYGFLNLSFFGKKLPMKNREYQAASTVAQWKYYMVMISDSGAVPSPTVYMQTRMTFTDV